MTNETTTNAAKADDTTPLVQLKLKHAKTTKGTFVYDIIAPNGMSAGSIYLPKLLLPREPGEILTMVLIEGDRT